MDNTPLRAYLVDDEQLATDRLRRLLARFPEIEIVGSTTDTAVALESLKTQIIDVLFLDIQMPGMNGFELLSLLDEHPFVIFTTAYDEYALKAFEVNSIDYLMKPIEVEHLERALKKLGRLRPITKAGWQNDPNLVTILNQLASTLRNPQIGYPNRIASRVGERISFLDLEAVTHFAAKEKLTYAVVKGHSYCVDSSITELEQRLNPAKFIRIHRAILLNVDWIKEVHSWFGGKVVVSLKDARQTELTVARDRVRCLKSQLGI